MVVTSQESSIDTQIYNPNDSMTWRASGIYGFPGKGNKPLVSMTNPCLHWLLFGDSNIIILSNTKKVGGNLYDIANLMTLIYKLDS
jgi:hypothetical protein